MSTSEQKFADTTGQIMLAAKDDRPLSDAQWKQARILLSNRRLILATSKDTQKVPLDDIRQIGGRLDRTIDARQVAEYVQLRLPGRTYLVAASEHERFKRALYRALLHGRSMHTKHPAVEGGVVTDAEWEPASLTLDDDGLGVALQSGRFVCCPLDELSGLRTDIREVDGDDRPVVAVSHLDEEDTIVETHLAAEEPTAAHLRTYLHQGISMIEANVDLSQTERAILTALYSGVSPFEIPAFLGRDVETVEKMYERLIDLDLVEEVRRRREVRLNARGRNITDAASDKQ